MFTVSVLLTVQIFYRYNVDICNLGLFTISWIYGIAITPPVSATPAETPLYGYLKVPKIPSIKSELAAAAAN